VFHLSYVDIDQSYLPTNIFRTSQIQFMATPSSRLCVHLGVKLYSQRFLRPHCRCWCRADCFSPLVPVVLGRVCVPTVAGRRTISQLHAGVSWVIPAFLTHSVQTHIFSIHLHRSVSLITVRVWLVITRDSPI